jgi:hypothetical protein
MELIIYIQMVGYTPTTPGLNFVLCLPSGGLGGSTTATGRTDVGEGVSATGHVVTDGLPTAPW